MNQFLTILKFSFITGIKNKVYIATTVAFAVIIAILLCIPRLTDMMSSSDTTSKPAFETQKTIVIVDQSKSIISDTTGFAQNISGNYNWVLESSFDQEAMKSRIEKSAVYCALVIHSPTDIQLYVKNAMSFSLNTDLENYLQRQYLINNFKQYNIKDADYDKFLAKPLLNVLEVGSGGKTMEGTYAYTYILIFLLFMSVMMYGVLVATSVATEKSSRAMEILITSAKPKKLMFGKVIGMGLVGLVQISVYILTAILFALINADYIKKIPLVGNIVHIPAEVLIFAIVFYITGYFLYAVVFGAIGSLVSRTEDINTLTVPVYLVLMAGFMISVIGMIDPNGSLVVVSSFIPFFAPMAMFVRISMTSVPIYQILISTSLLLLTIFYTGILSAKIYKLGVLMYGKPPSIKEVVKALKKHKVNI